MGRRFPVPAPPEAPPRYLQDNWLCEICRLLLGVRALDQRWLCEACIKRYLKQLEAERWRV